MSHEAEPESQLRPLTDGERSVATKLLSEDFPGCDALRGQLADARGRRIDENGSLELVADRSAHRAAVVRRIPVEAEMEDCDGVRIHVLLHVVRGYMGELEVYREDSGRVQRRIRPEALRVIVDDCAPGSVK